MYVWIQHLQYFTESYLINYMFPPLFIKNQNYSLVQAFIIKKIMNIHLLYDNLHFSMMIFQMQTTYSQFQKWKFLDLAQGDVLSNFNNTCNTVAGSSGLLLDLSGSL